MTDPFARVKDAIADTLGALLPQQSDIAQPMVDAMRHAVLGGGKRMRPLMACATCEAFSGSFKAALPAACGLELSSNTHNVPAECTLDQPVTRRAHCPTFVVAAH
mgnify:CR=1 FL=1